MAQGYKSLTISIVERLGMEIVRGTYNEGNPFPTEADLCTEYEVSRSVLREAVKMLTSKGLLSARPRQGTKVQDESKWNLLDPSVLRWLLERDFSLELLSEFTEVRLSIDPAAAALAAERASQEEKLNIKAALERMEAAEEGMDDPLLSDIAFHVAILDASGNRFFSQMQDFSETALRISIRLTNQRKGVRLASVRDHEKVLDAIMAGKPELARSAMQYLLQEAMDLIADARKLNAE